LIAELTSAIAVIVAAAHQFCLLKSVICLLPAGVAITVVKDKTVGKPSGASLAYLGRRSSPANAQGSSGFAELWQCRYGAFTSWDFNRLALPRPYLGVLNPLIHPGSF
jgi:hypothetical protein